MRAFRYACAGGLIFGLSIFLSACGGGGGSTTGGTSNPPAIKPTFTSCTTNNPYFQVVHSTPGDYIYYIYSTPAILVKDPANFKCSDTLYASDGQDVYFGDKIVLGADPKTFVVINDAYGKDKYSVYFRYTRIPVADVNNFKLLQPDSHYATDNGQFYYDATPIYPADPATFQAMGQRMAQDSRFVYEDGKVSDAFKDLDTSTFRHLGGAYYADGTQVYWAAPDSYPLGFYLNETTTVFPVASANPDTVSAAYMNYLSDASGVYYQRNKFSSSTAPLTELAKYYAKVGNVLYYTSYPLAGANPDTTTFLSPNIAVDGEHIYYGNKDYGASGTTNFTVNESYIQTPNYLVGRYNPLSLDQATAQFLGGGYMKDSTQVWFNGTALTNADPATFTYLGVYAGIQYAKDANAVYIQQNPSTTLDPASFQLLSNYYYINNGQITYSNPAIGVNAASITSADAASFQVLNDAYAKDKNNVYFAATVVPGADPASFQTVNSHYGKDATQVFYQAAVVNGADPASFDAINNYFGKDSNSVYYNSSPITGADPASFQVLLYLQSTTYTAPTFLSSDATHTFIGTSAYQPDLNINNLKLVGSSIFADNTQAIIGRKLVDLVNFRFLSDYYYINNGQVFNGNGSTIPSYTPISGANPDTFTAIALDKAKDDKSVFFGYTALPDLDPATTTVLASGGFVFDTNTLYASNQLVSGVDVPNLYFYSVMSEMYYNDSHAVYCQYQPLMTGDTPPVPADLSTFHVVASIGFVASYDVNWNYKLCSASTHR